MYREMLVEEGIVASVEEGFAEITVTESENCNECSAKIICKPGSGSNKTIRVIDPYGVKTGDKVKISIEGRKLLGLSILLYLVPLTLMFVCILCGLSILPASEDRELFSFLIGLILMGIYYAVFYWINSRRKLQIMPKIIFLKRNTFASV